MGGRGRKISRSSPYSTRELLERLAFVHWCYNLQVKEKQKLTFQTNDSLLVIEVYNFCYEVMDKVSEEIIYIKHEFDS